MKYIWTMMTIIMVPVMILAETGVNLNQKPESPFSFNKLVNEISLYQNSDDDFNDLGRTLQIISINSFRIFTDFNFEFTGDFNWDMTEKGFYDYYLELSIVKPLHRYVSLNYQRIYGTFVNKPVNQWGIRITL